MFGETIKRKVIGTVMLTLALSFVAGAASSKEQVIVQLGTGDWAAAIVKAYVEPFEKETGIEVVVVNEWANANKLKLWHESGKAGWDVAQLGGANVILGGERGWLKPLDYDAFDSGDVETTYEAAKNSHGVGVVIYSSVLAYHPAAFPNGAPNSWAEFWDVEGFPGKRTLVHGEKGFGPWYFAALADGVPIDQLYPLDMDRAFASLRKIRPHVLKWWKTGSEVQQLFADNFVDVGEAYNGRIANLQKQGLPILFNWNQGKMEMDYWVIPNDAPNPDNASKFIAFTMRPKQQAILAGEIPYGPTNKSAHEYIDAEIAATLPTHPDHVKNQFFRDYEWEAAEGENGKSNMENLIDRWNRFMLGE